ncbi:NUDIX hydrolase domain-like protein [Lasiosphaeria ovina]|uniref:NUDIX hydrolase domain-like protein n=1 Tax=Lasiosphaeria ovina TaxID=92902 RepID=A0AAE0JU01_9PEZI|nr:NUDIX hydrolase domain-like protein [Lasiosphaeria ovina]
MSTHSSDLPFTGFTFSDAVSALNISPAAYKASHPSITGGLVVGAVVIVGNSPPRMLLIQRAPSDGWPLDWECPGGGVDAQLDATLLQAVARELSEESGLVAAHIEAVLDEYEFGDGGDRWRKITCLVRVKHDGRHDGPLPPVTLAPDEHCDYVWASEEEVRLAKCDGREIRFAYDGAVKQIFVDALQRHGAV